MIFHIKKIATFSLLVGVLLVPTVGCQTGYEREEGEGIGVEEGVEREGIGEEREVED